MIFTSDNAVGAAPEILEAIVGSNGGAVPSYGADDLTARVEARLRDIFETDLRAFLVTTGTAANALALASVSPPWGTVFCHRAAHIEVDECGAPEFFGGGLKLALLDGADGKIAPKALEAALAQAGAGGVHQVQPAALSLTNLTEHGALYSSAEMTALTALAHGRSCAVHLDGTRFGNAIAASGAAPADLSWRAGIDILCLGATKSGALAAEAVIFFDPDRQAERIAQFEYRRKRGGHLLSKGRLLAAQMDAYLADDLWLRLAHAANERAADLAQGLRERGIALDNKVAGNMIFAWFPQALHHRLKTSGAAYYVEPPAQDEAKAANIRVRLVTSFATTAADVTAFLDAMG